MKPTIFKLFAVGCVAAGLAACADDQRGGDDGLWRDNTSRTYTSPDINSGENRNLHDAADQTPNSTGTNDGRPNNLESPSPIMPGTDGNFNSGGNPNNMPR